MRTHLSTLALSVTLTLGTPVAHADSYAPALFGALFGGVVGNQLSHGHHHRTATVAGAVVGAALAQAIADSQRPAYHPHPVRRRPARYWQGYDERHPAYYEADDDGYYEDGDYGEGDYGDGNEGGWDWEQ